MTKFFLFKISRYIFVKQLVVSSVEILWKWWSSRSVCSWSSAWALGNFEGSNVELWGAFLNPKKMDLNQARTQGATWFWRLFCFFFEMIIWIIWIFQRPKSCILFTGISSWRLLCCRMKWKRDLIEMRRERLAMPRIQVRNVSSCRRMFNYYVLDNISATAWFFQILMFSFRGQHLQRKL